MKELETHLKAGIKTELNVKKKQEVEYVLEGTISPKNGHKVWEFNEETEEIKEAEYKKNTVVFNGFTHREPEELIIKANCIYIPALNAGNAKRKYLKNKKQSHYYVKPAPMDLKDITF